MVLNKPAGVFSIPDRYDKKKFNLFTFLTKKYGKIYTVHRLDKDTSGCIIFAKDALTHKKLNTLFEHNKVKKIYHIIVKGIIREDDLEIDIPILPHPMKKGLSMPSARGKESLTKVIVKERFLNSTFCEIDLITGRHHQIRVHMATIGHPLLIDDIYGNKTEFYLSTIKKRYNLKKNAEEMPIMSRLTMHAYSLEFKHPHTNEILEFKASYPRDFSALLQVLNKYSGLEEVDALKI